jgi:hypothetical protein
VPLKDRLVGTKWINTNEFIFEWDNQGKLWHSKDGQRNQLKCVYLGPKTVQITFTMLDPKFVHTIEFDDDLTGFTQFKKNGDVGATGKRFK